MSTLLFVFSCITCFIFGGILAFWLYSSFKDSKDFSKKHKEILAEIIKEEQEDLRKQQQEALDMKLKPLSENLDKFVSQILKLDNESREKIAVLKDNIEKLVSNNKNISEETKKLTEALTFNQNVKGFYGEDLLSCILENSGLKEHINYTKQALTTSPDSNGEIKTIRPDFIISLPNNKSLVIDSKFTLTSFIEFQDKKTKETKLMFKSELKKRIKDLSDKNYQKANGYEQPEFILCYIPLETAINLIYSDNDFADLIKESYDKNIIIVGTSSVITAINLVKELWAVQNRNDNYKEIADIGRCLYESFAKHFQELETLQQQFEKISETFTTTINRYKTKNAGDYSMLKQIERLKELGINPKIELPDEFLPKM